MDRLPSDNLLSAFGEAARTALAAGHEVPLMGIGVLRVRHQSGQITEDASGNRYLPPPRDGVVFEKEHTH